MQPTNNNITNTNQDLNIGNINPSIEVNIPQTSNIPLTSYDSSSLSINNRQISNSNAMANCNREYTASEFFKLLKKRNFPNHPITVVGDVCIKSSKKITKLPANLTVTGCLNIAKCPKLKSLPSNLKATEISICSCINLIEFEQNIEVDILSITLCRSLSKFNNTIVKKSLILASCEEITDLPVIGNEIQNISLYFLDSFTTLNKLTTMANIFILGCFNLISLAEDITIGGNFTIYGAIILTKLPNRLKVKGNIDVADCRSLTSLPSYWLANIPNNLPVTLTNNHSISFRNTGVSLEEINYYDDNTPYHINFLPDESELSLERLIKLWQAKILHKDIITITNITNQERQDLRQFLSKLTQTASAKNKNTEKYLAWQIINILKLLANTTEIKEQALLIINNTVSDCADRVSLGLAELEFLPWLFVAEKQSEIDTQGFRLLEVGRKKLLMEEIQKYAMLAAAEKDASAEEVEFILAYTIKLASYFALPITVRNMNHEGIANISDLDVYLASIVIDTKVTDEYFSHWLTSWEPWQKHSRRWSIYQYTALTSKRISKDDIASDSLCIISQDSLADITDPVYYNNQLYSYASLCNWYIEKGTNPVNPSETINLDEIYSLRIEELDNSDITAKRRKVSS